MKFIFLCSISISRYQVEHSKINFISPCAHVLFSIYIVSLHVLKNKETVLSLLMVSVHCSEVASFQVRSFHPVVRSFHKIVRKNLSLINCI